MWDCQSLHLLSQPNGEIGLPNAVNHQWPVRISQTIDELGKVELALAEIVDLKSLLRLLVRGNRLAERIGTYGTGELGESGIYLARKLRIDLSLEE